MKNFNLFIPITKVDEEKRLVYGLATAEQVDKSGEIFDYDSSKPFYKEWSGEIEKASGGKSLGNVREMHSPIAAGKLTQIVFNDEHKQIEVVAKIVNDSTWMKVLEGVLTGFSHGGEYVKQWKDKNDPKLTRYTARPAELSVVDNPCLGAATFELLRANGTSEMRKFQIKEEPVKTTDTVIDGKPVQPKATAMQKWVATDGESFEKKEDWRVHQLKLETDAAAGAGAGDKTDATGNLLKAISDVSKTLDSKEGKTDPTAEELAKAADTLKAARDAAAAGTATDEQKELIKKADDTADADKQALEKKKSDRLAEIKKAFDTIKKGFSEAYDAKAAIDALCILESLLSGEEWEAMWGQEAGDATQIADLKEAITRIKAFIAKEIMEDIETVEVMAMAITPADIVKYAPENWTAETREQFVKSYSELKFPDDMAKAGARHSAADKGQIGKAMGYLEDAMDSHEDAVKQHDHVEKSFGGMRKCVSAMADCMKLLASDMLKGIGTGGVAEAFKKAEDSMKGHVDEMEGHMDKAEKHHGKVTKAHDGMAAAHDGMKHAMKALGDANDNEADDDAEVEKTVKAELKKVTDVNATLADENKTLVQKNKELEETMTKVTGDLKTLNDRLTKMEATPMPAKGVLFDTTGGDKTLQPIQKGHEANDTTPAQPAEASNMTRGASPEQMRALHNR